MHHETAEDGKGGLCFILLPWVWRHQRLGASSVWYSLPAPSSPPRPIRSLHLPSHPPWPSKVCAVWLLLHKPATPCSRLLTFFGRWGGVPWWIYKAHIQTVGRVETHLCTQTTTVCVCEREKVGEQATVKLIRTSCVYFILSHSLSPSLYLWEALMWLSAWKLNEKCIIAFPFTVSTPFSFLSSPLL